MSLDKYLKGEPLDAFKRMRKIVDPIWDTTSEDWHVPDIGQRATLSLTKDETGQLVPCIHIEKADGWAHAQIKSMLAEYPTTIVADIGAGEAQAAYPEQDAFRKHASSGVIQPGVSVSHGRYRSGTLGCVVEVKGKDRNDVCIITAAHVVALNHKSVQDGDPIYSPGKGNVPRLLRSHAIGELTDQVTDIYPLLEAGDDPAEELAIDVDIALIRLTERGLERPPRRTFVPDPAKTKGPDAPLDRDMLHISQVVPEDALPERLSEEVYMFGAVSGFRRGVLTNVLMGHRIIKLPNRKNYLYRELLAIRSSDMEPFSQNGDSGSIIYTADGQLVGFLVGSDGYTSVCCIGERVLDLVKGKLV